MAAKSKLTPARIARIRELAEGGHTQKQIAIGSDCSTRQLTKWKKVGSEPVEVLWRRVDQLEFSDLVALCEKHDIRLFDGATKEDYVCAYVWRWEPQREVYRALTEGETVAFDRALKAIFKAIDEGPWQAAAWFLERRDPENYAPRYRTEITGKGGGPIETNETVTVSPKEALMKQVDQVGARRRAKKLASENPESEQGSG